MARTRELIGLIAGFATGTFLTALFLSTAPKSDKKKKSKAKEETEEEAETQNVFYHN